MSEQIIIEDYEVIEKRVVGRNADGSLEWWLVRDETPIGSSWRAFQLDLKGNIIQEPAWAPLPGAQQIALSCPIFEMLMDGNRGSGKSELLLVDYARDVKKGWGAAWRGILFRKQLGDLDEMVRKAEALYSKLYGNQFRFLHSKSDYRCVWDTGEELLFRHLLNVDEYQEYHGHQYPWLGFEELTQWEDDKPYRKMFSCVRPTTQGIPTRVRANTNPCVDEGEVMTPKGWRDIRTMEVGDDIYSFDGQGLLRRSKVTAVRNSWFDGELVRREGRGLYMSFTPNHRLPKIGGNRGNSNGKKPGNHVFTLTPFDELPGQAFVMRAVRAWQGQKLESFSVPLQQRMRVRRMRVRRNPVVLTMSGTDYAEFMGWYLSEGCTVPRDRAFQISQMKVQHRATIKNLLDRCGFYQSWSAQSVTVSSAEWYEYLKQFGKCRDKFVPRQIMESDVSILRAFFDAAMNGDGHKSGKDSGQYYTTSKRLADDVAEIAVKLGYTVYTSSRQRENRDGLSYSVNFAPARNVMLATGQHRYEVSTSMKENIKRVPFNGLVHCVEVAGDETFVIRQRGTIWLSGNSGVGHNWVKKRFQLPAMHGRVIRKPGEEARVAIKLDLKENFILLHTDPGYINRIQAAASSPAEGKAWATGDWDVTFGGMFDDLWDANVHIVPDIKPMMIPRGWTITRSYDHGQSHPFACLWWAESNGEPMKLPDGRWVGRVRGDIILFKEWYGTTGEENVGLRMLSKKIAEGIRDRQNDMGIGNRVNAGPADTEIWTKRDVGETATAPIDDFEAVLGYDCWEKADKTPGSRIRGWQKIREYLGGAKPAPDGSRETPGLFVCAGCTYWISLVPSAGRDPANTDEVPKSYEDHLGDATRYRLCWSPTFAHQRGF